MTSNDNDEPTTFFNWSEGRPADAPREWLEQGARLISEGSPEAFGETDPEFGSLDVDDRRGNWINRYVGEWVTAYRFISQGGSLVIAEVRVFPRERNAFAGEWSGTWSPPGGIPSDVVRSIRVSKVRLSKAELARVRRDMPGVAERLGIGRKSAKRPATRKVPDELLARAARCYLDAVAVGAPRVYRATRKTLAKLGWDYSETYVRDLVQRARNEDFLTSAGRGRAGGELTEKTQEILRNITKEQ